MAVNIVVITRQKTFILTEEMEKPGAWRVWFGLIDNINTKNCQLGDSD